MKSITKCLIVSLLAISACGPLQQDEFAKVIASGLASRVTGGSGTEAVASSAPSINRAFIEAQQTDLVIVNIPTREATAVLVHTGTNGSKTTWFSPEQIGVVYDNGLLIGTRGLGNDLMGANVSGAKSSLRGGGTHVRILDFLDGLDQVQRFRYDCRTVRTDTATISIFERTYNTSVFEETCSGDSGSFTNTYWRDANGVIWQSRQWVSPDVGYMGYQRL